MPWSELADQVVEIKEHLRVLEEGDRRDRTEIAQKLSDVSVQMAATAANLAAVAETVRDLKIDFKDHLKTDAISRERVQAVALEAREASILARAAGAKSGAVVGGLAVAIVELAKFLLAK